MGGVTYRAFAKGRWLPSVTNHNEVNSKGYAGIAGNAIQGLKINSSKGDIYYRVKIAKGGWLSEVTNSGNGPDGYAGIYGKDIDCVQVRVPSGGVSYRVRILNGKWLNWICSNSNYGPTSDTKSYAGIPGKSIDMIQISLN